MERMHPGKSDNASTSGEIQPMSPNIQKSMKIAREIFGEDCQYSDFLEIFKCAEGYENKKQSRGFTEKPLDKTEHNFLKLQIILFSKADENEIAEESSWIFKRIFQESGFSHESFDLSAVVKIQQILKCIRNFNLQANHMDKYINEFDLSKQDLLLIYKWNEKWCQLRQRKLELHQLFQHMQEYQTNKMMNKFDIVQAAYVRLLTDNIYRVTTAQTFEELEDCYADFMLYYGQDVAKMKEALEDAHKDAENGGQIFYNF